jgi:hypothetical protein
MTQAQVIAQAVAAAVAALNGKQPAKKAKGRRGRGRGQRVNLTDEQKTANAAENAKVAEAAFEKAGFKDNRANVTIKTYKGWMEAGRKVKPGEKSLKHPTKGYPLFHVSQTDELVATAQSTDTVQ